MTKTNLCPSSLPLIPCQMTIFRKCTHCSRNIMRIAINKNPIMPAGLQDVHINFASKRASTWKRDYVAESRRRK